MIKLIVLDVDGCLSDGKIFYSSDIIENKSFNVKDGLGITTWNRIGNYSAIITGRQSTIVEHRAKELGITHYYQNIKDKDRVLKEIVNSLGIDFSEVAVIGDDLNDYKMLKLAGKSFTPNNGVKAIQEIVDVVLSKDGGEGAIREMIDILIDENSQREEFMSIWI